MDSGEGLIRVDDLLSWQNVIIAENCTQPETNIYVVNDRFIIVANMPGVSRENVRVEVSDNELTIYGKATSNFEMKKCDFYLKEFKSANFMRKFILSESIDCSNVEAKYENGQLTLILPKHRKYEKHEILIR
jgi:HSP20 family protein